MSQSTALASPFQPTSASRSELAAMTFLAAYTGATYETYRTTLNVLFNWFAKAGTDPLDATRPVLELFGRYLENERHNSPVTVVHHLSIVKCFYRMCAIDDLIQKSPAEHLRLPRIFHDESRTLGLDRSELGALIQTARASSPNDAALVTLLGMLGLRVSEACAVRVEDFQDEERGHRVLRVVGKGGKPATIPLPVPVWRTLDAAAGDRTSGALLTRPGTRYTGPMNRKSAAIRVQHLCRKAGITKHITPHSLRHAYITACLDAGAPLRDAQIAARHSDPRITARYDRARHNLDRHANHLVASFLAGAA